MKKTHFLYSVAVELVICIYNICLLYFAGQWNDYVFFLYVVPVNLIVGSQNTIGMPPINFINISVTVVIMVLNSSKWLPLFSMEFRKRWWVYGIVLLIVLFTLFNASAVNDWGS